MMDNKVQRLWTIFTTMGPLALALFLFLTIVEEYWYDITEKKQNTKILDKERHLRVLLQAAKKLKITLSKGRSGRTD